MEKNVIFFGGNFYQKEKLGLVWRAGNSLLGHYKGEILILDEYESEFLAKEGKKYLNKRLKKWN